MAADIGMNKLNQAPPMKQKDIFLQTEGDAWSQRNQKCVAQRKLPDGDAILREILDLPLLGKEGGEPLRVLEVGCGDGRRLSWLQTNMNMECFGIEPSAQAVAIACDRGIDVRQGTADKLPFADNTFDIVIFGFCLYLCDRSDLFLIAAEADRVLRSPAWLLILDFFSPVSRSRAYHHKPGVLSFKMDYRMLFTWHPDYECMTHKVRHHLKSICTDDSEEWVGLSVIRKYPNV